MLSHSGLGTAGVVASGGEIAAVAAAAAVLQAGPAACKCTVSG